MPDGSPQPEAVPPPGRRVEGARRLCPSCGGAEPVAPDGPVWPPGRACPHCGMAAPVADGIPLFAPRLADTLSGFDPRDFETLARIEPGHFWFEPRNRLLGALCARHAPAARRILEIGCGTGFVLAEHARRLPGARLVGAELHPSGLRVARERLVGRAEFVQMDARAIPAAGVFDLIGAFDVLEHIAEDEAATAAMRRALAPGGLLALAVPQHPELWSTADDVAHHVRRYRPGDLEAKLVATGLAPVFSGSYCALLLPLMAVGRWRQRRGARGGAPARASEAEARPAPWINALLRSVLYAEVSLTLAGLRLPAGGSRVVLAKRSDA